MSLTRRGGDVRRRCHQLLLLLLLLLPLLPLLLLRVLQRTPKWADAREGEHFSYVAASTVLNSF